MAAETVKLFGNTLKLSELEDLEGEALEEKLLEVNGIGEKRLPKALEQVQAALANGRVKQCGNFERCGNQAEPGHDYCSECHFEWRLERVEEEDQQTRPLRINVGEQFQKTRGYFASYYKNKDPRQWPGAVRQAFQRAQSHLEEGDELALEAASEEDPNPGLFSVVRFHFYAARDELNVASYHSYRISANGVKQGLSRAGTGQVRTVMSKAQQAMKKAEELEGHARSKQIRHASHQMRDVLRFARKKRSALENASPQEIYNGESIGNRISPETREAVADLASG